MIVIKRPDELRRMREAGRVVARVLLEIEKRVRPGVTTGELDRFAEEFIRAAGGEPSFKGYRGYPASICTSVNEEVVHGIPSGRRLEEGDIVSVDVGVLLDGFHGDAARTFAVGEVDPRTRRLLEVTERALEAGIATAREGNRISDIGHAVQRVVEGAGFSVVRDFVGHGIGRQMHEDPQVPNFGVPGRGPRLLRGMTIAIEPMVNAGAPDVTILEDHWTAVTVDGSRSAHFEHTVAISEDGPVILTLA
ncbi:type I methionyl aminopeptidase [Carboxydochorda subterranea]|uniref:Methionine aminopeptidase n=1 Tax=Carboxydichorda subterranea TaxID=3109565 RepID=A0ABZ1BYY6_9FIRM|nr:type I methionyl aminopeptidase [Limnochorda sp. L945t]WRP17735.1 type I methionyl aminopeptidase [Limnochorda sp. L945t]